MGGKSTLGTRQKALDSIFSKWVRLGAADEHGLVVCVTCPRKMYWMDSQAGHWVKRQHGSTRWDPRNVHPQCVRCNKWKSGEEDKYRQYIVDKYGQEVCDELEMKKCQIKKWTKDEIESLIDYYRQKVTELEERGLV